jgi:hypothetical protein
MGARVDSRLKNRFYLHHVRTKTSGSGRERPVVVEDEVEDGVEVVIVGPVRVQHP